MKGYEVFKKRVNPVKEIIKEHPQIQRAAYEAKYAANTLEELYNHLYTVTMSLNDVVGGLVQCLTANGIINATALDNAIDEYTKSRVRGEYEFKIKSLGFEEPKEIVEDNDLVEIKLYVCDDEGKVIPSYPKVLFLITGQTYLFPGLEEQLIGMKKLESKSFELQMPDKCKVKEIENKKLTFNVTILEIRERNKEKVLIEKF
jgi:hypothetical protein